MGSEIVGITLTTETSEGDGCQTVPSRARSHRSNRAKRVCFAAGLRTGSTDPGTSRLRYQTAAVSRLVLDADCAIALRRQDGRRPDSEQRQVECTDRICRDRPVLECRGECRAEIQVSREQRCVAVLGKRRLPRCTSSEAIGVEDHHTLGEMIDLVEDCCVGSGFDCGHRCGHLSLLEHAHGYESTGLTARPTSANRSARRTNAKLLRAHEVLLT